jgi:TolB-like protein
VFLFCQGSGVPGTLAGFYFSLTWGFKYPDMPSHFILFTDIPGYTRLSREPQTLLSTILKPYKAAIASAVEQEGGQLVHCRADKSLSLYDTASRALSAAMAIQAAVKDKAGIVLRTGIHYGDVHFVDDEAIGESINTALRICGVAIEGSVLVSELVYEQVSGNVDFAFRRLGLFRLKHAPAPLMLFSSGKTGTDLPGRDAFPADEQVIENSIAVLPFRDLSPEQDQGYLGQGFSEEIINNLSQMDGLKVTARSSSSAIAKRNLEIQDIGKALGVSHILEGSVRKAGDKIRVSTQMISARDGFTEFSLSFNREFKDIFDIQEELSLRIVENLKEKLDLSSSSDKFRNKHDWDPALYDLFLKGHYELHQGSRSHMQKAHDTFQKIIRIDPTFSPAHASLAICHLTQGIVGHTDRIKAFAATRAALDRAKELDPDYPWNKIARLMAEFWMDGWNLPKFHQYIVDLLQIYPGSAQLRMFYGMHYFIGGDVKRALMELKLASELDPISIDIKVRIMRVYFAMEDYKKCLEICDELLEIETGNPLRQFQRAWIVAFSGDHEYALKNIESFPEGKDFSAYKASALVYLYASLGKPEKAFRHLEILQEMVHREEMASPNFHLAVAYSGMKNHEKVLDHIEQGLENREFDFLFVQSEPMWKAYRNHERFRKICRRTFKGISKGRHVTIRTDTHEQLELNLADLWYVAAEDNYSRVFWKDGEQMKERLLRITLKNLEPQLEDPAIVRCHRSYLVNLAQDFEIKGDASGYSLASGEVGEEIPISRTRGKEILALFRAQHA